jgi:RES domain-containing protein
MEVFRISKHTHAKILSASGSANRWNLKGQYVLYAGSSRSLASLELVVHRGAIEPLSSYKVMVISLADEDYLIRQISSKELPTNWRAVAGYPALQRLGSAWYSAQETLVLKVPSAVIPYEYNYLINTEHPDFDRCVKLVRTEDYFWDDRLL